MAQATPFILDGFSQVVTVNGPYCKPDNPLGTVSNASVVVENGLISWIGLQQDIPTTWAQTKRLACHGLTLLPGLIDSHTHPVFAGNRADEFEMRLAGKTYLEIAQAGGGILKTVSATRQASESELLDLTRQRIWNSLAFGVTTLEAKSGYGLTTESELKSLRVLKQLQQEVPLTLIPTFMGAHDIPPEYKTNAQAYVDLVCQEMIPEVAKQQLAIGNDVFCETGYFDVEQSRRILETGLAHGLSPRIHAEEFTNIEGAAMSVGVGALSADHLLHLSDTGIAALAQSNTVATMLPGTAFYLKLNRYAPARKLLDAGATVAIATDFNPGSCMSQNIQLMMALACLHLGMLPHEVICGVTFNAAKALGLSADRGSLEVGKRADFALFKMASYHELLYQYGMNQIHQVWVGGQPVFTQSSGCDAMASAKA